MKRRRRLKKIDDIIWRKYYLLIPITYTILCIVPFALLMRNDLKLQRFCVDLDAPFADRFYHWRTDGLPGDEPPKD